MTYFDFTDFTKYPMKIYSSGTNQNLTNSSYFKLPSSPHYISAAGFSKSDINVQLVDNSVLEIKGEIDKYGKKTINTWLALPDDVDKESIEVSLSDGMITITFEKKKEESRKIKVK